MSEDSSSSLESVGARKRSCATPACSTSHPVLDTEGCKKIVVLVLPTFLSSDGIYTKTNNCNSLLILLHTTQQQRCEIEHSAINTLKVFTRFRALKLGEGANGAVFELEDTGEDGFWVVSVLRMLHNELEFLFLN
jgi:hypothetical protein